MEFQKLLEAIAKACADPGSSIRKALGIPDDVNFAGTLAALNTASERLEKENADLKREQTELTAVLGEIKGRLAKREKIDSDGGIVTLDPRGRIVPTLPIRGARAIQSILRLMLPPGMIDARLQDEAREFTRELNITTGSQGGFLIPPEFSTDFIALINVYSDPRKQFTVVPMSTAGPLTMPALDGDMTTYWVAEHEAPTESQPVFRQFSVTNQILAALTHLSLALLQDSNPAALQLVSQSMARAFAKEESRVGYNGKSVADGGSDKYTGLFNLTGATSSALAAGKTSITNIGLKDLTAAINTMIATVGNSGLQDACWCVHPTVLSVLEDLTDSTGRPIVRSPGDGDVSKLRGYPITPIWSAPSLADDAAGKAFIAFCNPKSMAIGDRQQVEIAQNDSVGFKNAQLYVRGMERIGFAPMSPAAIVLIKTAAS